MRILVTGAKGFMGKNLIARLNETGRHEIDAFDLDTPFEKLIGWCRTADFVFHLAGVNRPKEQGEFMTGNFGFTDTLLNALTAAGNRCPVMLASSTQAALDNPYGESKRAGEARVFRYAQETGASVYVFRFPNVFGKWSRPNYNSAVATFCSNIANGLPITVNNRETELTLLYIDDLCDTMLDVLAGKVECGADGICAVPVTHRAKLGRIADTIQSFRDSRGTLSVADQSDPLTRKLYATYLSFLPTDGFAYPLTMHADERGSFTEFLRTAEHGQVSINVAKPGVVKGNHYHHTKNEKFLVVSGSAVIRFRRPDADEVIEYRVSGAELTVVDIPTGYTHSIENVGTTDLVTVMWANEPFDPTHPDTVFLKV